MTHHPDLPCTAFAGDALVASGPLRAVIPAIMAATGAAHRPTVVVYDDATGAVVDLDLRGSPAEAIARLGQGGDRAVAPPPARAADKPRGRGRPRLGVVPREVTLLPRHWDWLAGQPGNVSQTLRRLVDDARRADRGQAERAARERTYRFLAAQAGNLPGFEDVIRALFAGQGDAFAAGMARWPEAIRDYAGRLAQPPAPGDTP